MTTRRRQLVGDWLVVAGSRGTRGNWLECRHSCQVGWWRHVEAKPANECTETDSIYICHTYSWLLRIFITNSNQSYSQFQSCNFNFTSHQPISEKKKTVLWIIWWLLLFCKFYWFWKYVFAISLRHISKILTTMPRTAGNKIKPLFRPNLHAITL